MEAENDASRVLDHSTSQFTRINEEELKRDFKGTIDEIKSKYEAAIVKLQTEHEQRVRELEVQLEFGHDKSSKKGQ
jgi:hypothetical protein